MKDYFKRITKYYKPSEPIELQELFVGREGEQSLLYKSLISRGRHPIIYGVRGIGKTSLLNVTCKHFCYNNDFIAIKHICSHSDNFANIFNTFLRISSQNKREDKLIEKSVDDVTGGFDLKILKSDFKGSTEIEMNYSSLTETTITPSLISEIFEHKKYLLIIDEFDLINNPIDKQLIAETIKALSDRNSETTIVISGVGNTLSDLVMVHNSIIRNLISIELPSMPSVELSQIIDNGAKNLGLEFTDEVKKCTIWLSDGLPYFTHLISETLADHAFFNDRKTVTIDDLRETAPAIVSNMALKEIVIHNYKRAFSNTMSLFSSPVDDFNSYSPQTRKAILNLYSHVDPEDNNSFQSIIESYSKIQGIVGLDAIKVEEIEYILSEITRKSEILQVINGKYFFKDAFHKAYTRINSLYFS